LTLRKTDDLKGAARKKKTIKQRKGGEGEECPAASRSRAALHADLLREAEAAHDNSGEVKKHALRMRTILSVFAIDTKKARWGRELGEKGS